MNKSICVRICMCIDENNETSKMVQVDKKTLGLFNQFLACVSAGENEGISIKDFDEKNCHCICDNKNQKSVANVTKKENPNKEVVVKSTNNTENNKATEKEKRQASLSVSSVSTIKKVDNKNISREVIKPVATKTINDHNIVFEKERIENETDSKKEIKEFFAMKNASEKNQSTSTQKGTTKKKDNTKKVTIKKDFIIEDKKTKGFEPVVVSQTREIEITKSPITNKTEQVKITQSTDARMARLSERLNAIRGTNQQTEIIAITQNVNTIQAADTNNNETEVRQIIGTQSTSVKKEVTVTESKSANVSAMTSQQQKTYDMDFNPQIVNNNRKEIEFKKSVKVAAFKKNNGKYNEDEVNNALAGLLRAMTSVQRQKDDE